MTGAGTAPATSRSWWGSLVFPLSLLLALLNGLALFFTASWVSVPEHQAVPNGQPLLSAEAAAAQAAPLWGLLILIGLAVVASLIAELRGHARMAMWLGAIQLLPVGLLVGAAIVSPFLI